MAQRKSFIINVGKVFSSKILIIILKLGLGVLTARVFGVTGKGFFVLANQIPGFFTKITDLSLGEALTVFISKDKIPRKHIFGTLLVLFLTVSTTSTILYYLFLPLMLDSLWSDAPKELPYLAGLMIPTMIAEYYGLFAIRGTKKYNLYLTLSVLSKICVLSALFIGYLTTEMTIVSGITIFIASNLLFGIIYFFFVFLISEKKVKTRISHLKDTLHYGFRIHPSTLLSDLEYRFDLYLLAFFLAADSIGLYSVAVTLAQISWYLTNSVTTILLPELGSSDSNQLAKRTALACRNTVFLTICTQAFVICFGYFLISLLYGTAFVESYFVTLVLLPGILMDSAFRILSTYYKNINNALLLNTCSGLSLAANIVLNIILIPKYGIYGAAISSSLTYSIKSILALRIFCQNNNYRIRELLLLQSKDVELYRGVIKKGFAKFSRFIIR